MIAINGMGLVVSDRINVNNPIGNQNDIFTVGCYLEPDRDLRTRTADMIRDRRNIFIIKELDASEQNHPWI